MAKQDNNFFRLECERCRQLSNEVEKCQNCSRFVCKDCMDEYSGLCLDCTRALLKDPDEYLERLRQLAIEEEIEKALEEYDEMMGWVEEEETIDPLEFIGTKCRYCGADVFDEESEYGEIDYNLRKYGYIVCPKCGMILFPEDLVDE